MPPVLSKLPVMMSVEDVIDKRYENCVIYKLVHKEDEDKYEKYVGHTIVGLNNRMKSHKLECNNDYRRAHNLKVYKYIRENGGIDMWEIVKIIDYPCKNEIEAGKKEGEYITSLKASLNTHLEGRSYKEWYEANKEELLKKQKEYQLNNPHIYLNRCEKIICDNCGSKIRKGNISHHKKTKKCLEHNGN